MQIDKIVFSKSVEVHVAPGEWLRAEAGGTFNEGEMTMEDALTKVADRLDNWLKTRIPAMTDFNTGAISKLTQQDSENEEKANLEFEQFKKEIDAMVSTGQNSELIISWMKINGWHLALDAKKYVKSKLPNINL